MNFWGHDFFDVFVLGGEEDMGIYRVFPCRVKDLALCNCIYIYTYIHLENNKLLLISINLKPLKPAIQLPNQNMVHLCFPGIYDI